jgi:hypothetical protein
MASNLILRLQLGLASLLLTACAWSAAEPITTPPEHRRGPEQTYLTFPEWFLVHSPAEYALYLRAGPPSRFPLFAHIGQFWSAYRAVGVEAARYPFNGGYHVMICVIGTSTTVEYGLKGLYERTAGRLSEASASGRQTEEDRFAARVAQEYVDFIREQPWYLFDFWSRLEALWTEVPPVGPNLLRKWERRYALTTEYLVKEGYARLIKLGTQSTYDAPKPVTAVVVDMLPPEAVAELPALQVLAGHPGGRALVLVPRYHPFGTHAAALAGAGAGFEEIAGNTGEILVSLLAGGTWRPADPGCRLLLAQNILTQPGRQRLVMAVRLSSLAPLLRSAEAGEYVVEHVYDY